MSHRKAIMLLVCSMLVFAYTASGQEKRTPDISIQERKWDFGTIEQYKVVTHEFSVENKGNADLIINNVRSS